MEIFLKDESGIKLPKKLLIKTAQTVLQKLGYDKETELSVSLVKDSTIKKLNKDYRAKNYTTDVLSFSTAPDFPTVTKFLGDIVISVNTAKRNAKEDKHSLNKELVILLVHGILHLAGYDHENATDKETKKMMKKQQELLAEVLD